MALNKNIFYATNPAKMPDALWALIDGANIPIQDMLIFLPSRRAVRTVEKLIAKKSGGVAILPTLVALGEGTDDEFPQDEPTTDDTVSNTMRTVVLAKLLSADANITNMSTALSVAHDLIRMQDYLENEGIDAATIDWAELVDEKYATHFQGKAQILNILSKFMDEFCAGRMTQTQSRNQSIRDWIGVLDKYKLVIVCGSTASVPATADLMCAVAHAPHGRIILSGKLDGRPQDFELNTNPYNSEYKFLSRLGIDYRDLIAIDVGPSAIDSMNYAFGNNPDKPTTDLDLSHCCLINVPRESTEANVVAQIATHAIANKKSVLVITPDAAGNQRIAASLAAHGIIADFSGGTPGTMTPVGRAIINLFDDWIETGSNVFDKIYAENNYDFFNTIATVVEINQNNFAPQFTIDDPTSVLIWGAINELSDALKAADLKLNLADARAFLFDCISGISVRGAMNPDADVVILGTIESRMQTADIVILTGLNEGMFPARGYENAWLPRSVAEKIGLPSPDRKVSLQSLDFMNLSCGDMVYWIRSTQSGGVQTTESRFLSRIIARGYKFATDDTILQTVLARDNVAPNPLDYSAPTPPADWSDVYVTELEHLIHNPFSFYVKHILRLRKQDDYWTAPDARDFGNLVHAALENPRDISPDALVRDMDRRAQEKLGNNSVIYHFWHKRFLEIAPIAANELSGLQNSFAEIDGKIKIAGRTVRARADRVWDGGVLDIKTGAAPNKSQLEQGNMPQLPLEAFMLQNGGFRSNLRPETPVIKFLQLKNGDVRTITYDGDILKNMINAAVLKTTELFNIYSAGGAPYEYRETNDQKYKQFDDLARIKD